MENISISKEPAVLIVGAGPVGVTLALQLQRLGVSYRLIEKNAGPSNQTKAVAIHSRTLEIFRELGIAEGAVEAGYKIHRFRVDSDGRTILKYDFDLLDATYPFLLSLPQPTAEALLLQQLEEQGGCVEWCTELTAMTQNEHQVDATLTHADGRQEQVSTRWLAGCDGARSAVRRYLGLAYKGESYHQSFMLADVDIDWKGSREEGVFFLGAQEGYVGVAPLNGSGRYRMFVLIPHDLPPEEQRPELNLATFQSLCEGRGHAMHLSNESSTTASGFQHRRVDRQQVGRVFLVGDAAHIGSPIGGQWMNLGVSDAYNLAWKLAYVERGLATRALLDSYDQERRPVTVLVERTSHILTKIFTLRSRPLVALRDTIFPRLSSLPKMRRKLPWLISGHSHNYRTSPLVENASGASKLRRRKSGKAVIWQPPMQAGELAPDIVLWQKNGAPQKHLLDHFGRKFTLLLFVGGDESSSCVDEWVRLGKEMQDAFSSVHSHIVIDALEAPARTAAISTILDPDWRLHDRYNTKDPALILIRPDGYLAFIGTTSESLMRYMETRSTLIRDPISATSVVEPQLDAALS